MGFKCTYQLNNGAIADSDEIIFEEFIEESFTSKEKIGTYNKEKIKIAKIIFNGKPGFIYSNSPSLPLDKEPLKKGDKLNSHTKIATFAAEGEDIPYNLPFAIIRFD